MQKSQFLEYCTDYITCIGIRCLKAIDGDGGGNGNASFGAKKLNPCLEAEDGETLDIKARPSHS